MCADISVSRGFRQHLLPCRDVNVVPVGVRLFLVREVGVERGETVSRLQRGVISESWRGSRVLYILYFLNESWERM